MAIHSNGFVVIYTTKGSTIAVPAEVDRRFLEKFSNARAVRVVAYDALCSFVGELKDGKWTFQEDYEECPIEPYTLNELCAFNKKAHDNCIEAIKTAKGDLLEHLKDHLANIRWIYKEFENVSVDW